jgi:hypothetical protein
MIEAIVIIDDDDIENELLQIIVIKEKFLFQSTHT